MIKFFFCLAVFVFKPSVWCKHKVSATYLYNDLFLTKKGNILKRIKTFNKSQSYVIVGIYSIFFEMPY